VVVKTAASVSFIATVAVIAVIVGSRSTVLDGRVLEADLLPRLRATPRHQRLASMSCDAKIPVTTDGAQFRCALVRDDGATVIAQFTMDRAGSFEERILAPAPRYPGGDAWSR
jgi:hypothetical protein